MLLLQMHADRRTSGILASLERRMKERHWYIKRCRLFERLTDEQLARLELRARVRRFPRKSPVYLPSDAADGVFLLAEGRIKLCSTTPEGKQAILAFIEPGEVFGEISLLGEGAEREEMAEAVAPSTVIFLPGDELEQLMSDSSQLSLSVTKLVSWRRRRIERRLKTLLFRSNRERLIHLLLELSEQYGKPDPNGILLDIRLSHHDLASVIGTTRETVTILLGELQLEGFLKVARQRIVIRKLEPLAQSVYAKAPSIPGGQNETPPSHPAKKMLNQPEA
jgi:CRP-like cAMP-binding protein